MAHNIQQLPPPLLTSEAGSFARATIVERKPEIIRRVLADNAYPTNIVAALETFRDEIAHRPIAPLTEDAPDVNFWNAQQARYAGKTWLDVPWYFAETYFYRRVLEAARYFQPGPWRGRDPFAKQKREQEAIAVAQLATVWAHIEALLPEERFVLLLHSALWGNRADLSNFTVKESAHRGLDTHTERANLLMDDTDAVFAWLDNRRWARSETAPLLARSETGQSEDETCQSEGEAAQSEGEVAQSEGQSVPSVKSVDEVIFINDNVGADSLFDLALADFLLTQGWARHVVFYLKNQPFFVSDAMPEDIRLVIRQLRTVQDPTVVELGARLQTYLITNRLSLMTDPFWTSCRSFWELPPALRDDLSRADLILLKGDVNYRRLFDDRHWDHATPVKTADAGFPKPYLILRTLKGEIMVGLQPGQAEILSVADPTWLINGKRGIIQLVTE